MGFFEESDKKWEEWKDEGSYWKCPGCKYYSLKLNKCLKYNNKPIYISDKQCNRVEEIKKQKEIKNES